MDADDMTSMFAQIVGGSVKKKDSRFVTDDESSKAWDDLAADVAKPLAKGGVWDMVNEIP